MEERHAMHMLSLRKRSLCLQHYYNCQMQVGQILVNFGTDPDNILDLGLEKPSGFMHFNPSATLHHYNGFDRLITFIHTFLSRTYVQLTKNITLQVQYAV